MAKINTSIRLILVIIITGIIIIIDNNTNITKISIEMMISKIFRIEYIHNITISYTSIYASIAVILSSGLSIIKKIMYSIGLFILYVIITTLVTIYIFRYDELLSYIWFMTMSIPILLWKFVYKDDKLEVIYG